MTAEVRPNPFVRIGRRRGARLEMINNTPTIVIYRLKKPRPPKPQLVRDIANRHPFDSVEEAQKFLDSKLLAYDIREGRVDPAALEAVPAPTEAAADSDDGLDALDPDEAALLEDTEAAVGPLEDLSEAELEALTRPLES